MGDRSAITDINGEVFFTDDTWHSPSPLHGEQSPPATQSSGNTARGHPHTDYLPTLAQPFFFSDPRATSTLPSSSDASNEDSSSQPIIPNLPSPSPPGDVPWNVLLSSDSESNASHMPSQRSRRGRQLIPSNSHIGSSQHNSSAVVDLTQEASTPPRIRMPSTSSPRGPNKRRRVESDASTQPSRRNQRQRTEQNEGVLPDVEEVDLRDVDDDKGLLKVLEDQRMATIKSQQEQASKPVKLATLSCVICMESMTDVTATFCGHLFCHKCLMEALIAGENQGSEPGKGPSKCPVCRKKIKRPGTGKRDTGQVVALEIKVKKRDDKGKSKTSRDSKKSLSLFDV